MLWQWRETRARAQYRRRWRQEAYTLPMCRKFIPTADVTAVVMRFLLAVVEEGHICWLRELPGWPQETDGRLWQAMLHTAPVDWPWWEVLHSHAGLMPARCMHWCRLACRASCWPERVTPPCIRRSKRWLHPCRQKNVELALAPRCTASAGCAVFSCQPIRAAGIVCHGKGGAATVLPVSKARVHLVLRLLARRCRR